jgi:hypothetical protein
MPIPGDHTPNLRDPLGKQNRGATKIPENLLRCVGLFPLFWCLSNRLLFGGPATLTGIYFLCDLFDSFPRDARRYPGADKLVGVHAFYLVRTGQAGRFAWLRLGRVS